MSFATKTSTVRPRFTAALVVPADLRGRWIATRVVTSGRTNTAPPDALQQGDGIEFTATELQDRTGPDCVGQPGRTATLFGVTDHWAAQWNPPATPTVTCAGRAISGAEGEWSTAVSQALDQLLPTFTVTRLDPSLTLRGHDVTAVFTR